MAAPMGHEVRSTHLVGCIPISHESKSAELDALTPLTIVPQAPWHCDFGANYDYS